MPHHDRISNIFQAYPSAVTSIESAQNLFDGQQIYQGVGLQDQDYGADCFTWQKYICTKNTTSTISADQGGALLPPRPESLNSHITNPTRQGAQTWGCSLFDLHNQTSTQLYKETYPNESVPANGNESAFSGWAYPPWEGFAQNAQWGRVWMLGAGQRYTQQQVNLSDAATIDLEATPNKDEEGNGQQDHGDDADVSLSAGHRSSQAYSPTPSVEKEVELDQRAAAKKVDKDISTAGTAGPSAISQGPSRQRKKLTVEQKRSNHIRYEKRRRALIRDRFTALAELLPGLDGENCSKSRTLFSAVEQLQVLLEKNKLLQEQVDMLKRDK